MKDAQHYWLRYALFPFLLSISISNSYVSLLATLLNSIMLGIVGVAVPSSLAFKTPVSDYGLF